MLWTRTQILRTTANRTTELHNSLAKHSHERLFMGKI